jgi:CHASE2 domain-containing sensor protein/DNA-binding CsgD family transcriptional regulator
VEKPGFPGKAGFINISVDDDNVIRQSDLVEEYRGKYYYSFALRIAESTRNTRLESAEYRPGKFLKIKGLGEIPLYGKNSMLINYSGTQGSFYELSFFQVYQNQVPASLIKDKIVLIGPTLTGINDYHLTPFRKGQGVERYMAGIEIHAHILNTLLNQNWVHFLNPLFQLAFLFFLSIVQVAVFWLYNSYKKLLFTWLGELVLYYSIAFILYLEFSTVVYLIFPGIVLTVLYLFLIFISQLMTLYEQKQMMGKLKSEIEKMQLSFEKIPENFFRDHEISKREEEIISLILENHTNKQIGKKLFISESTVKKHIYNIFQKLGINKRSELLEVLSENLSRN